VSRLTFHSGIFPGKSAVYQALQQRVGTHAIGTVKSGGSTFPRCPQTSQRRTAVQIHGKAANEVMHGGPNGKRFRGEINAKFRRNPSQQGEATGNPRNFGAVQIKMGVSGFHHAAENCPTHHVARGKIAIGMHGGHHAFAMAIQNIVWGLTTPFVGAMADKYGSGRMIVLRTPPAGPCCARCRLAPQAGRTWLFG